MSNSRPFFANHEAIHVLVADSTPLQGRLIAGSLSRDRDLEVVDTGAFSVVALAADLAPHVIILSGQLDGKPNKGFEVLKELGTVAPQARVIMLLDSDEPHSTVAAYRGGARGVFCRNNSLKLLIRCVHKVHEGELWAAKAQLEFLLETLAIAPATRLVDSQGAVLLSPREQEVVRWLAEGLTNGQIARQLNLSENTIKNYLFRIYNKLGVSTRVEAVIYAASQTESAEQIGR